MQLPYTGAWIPTLSGLLLVGTAYILLGYGVKLLYSSVWGTVLFYNRLALYIPSVWGFILFCLLLRVLEGVGVAMFTTATFATFAKFFPDSVGTLMVTNKQKLWCMLFHSLHIMNSGIVSRCCRNGLQFGPTTRRAPLLCNDIDYHTCDYSLLYHKVGGYKLPFIIVGAATSVFALPCGMFVRNISEFSCQTPQQWLLMTDRNWQEGTKTVLASHIQLLYWPSVHITRLVVFRWFC